MKRLLLLLLLLLTAPTWGAPLWWQEPAGPAYQVLVYSYADSNGDGIGDLAGLTHRLDAVKSLGTSAIWLSPIHPAASYHGYDVVDYKAVSPDLGTLADFDRFVNEAHARNIHVILDMVFNHSSSHHLWFKNKPEWYVTKKDGVDYGTATMGGWQRRADGSAFFATFWDQMPDLDVSNPEVIAEFKSVLKFWLDRGVDGFRFDAAKEIFNSGKVARDFPVVVKTKEWWNVMRDYARSINPGVYFIGEVSTTSNLEVRAYAGAFDGLFDFAQAKAALVDIPVSGEASKLAATLDTNFKLYGRVAGYVNSPFLSNHDQDRAMSVTLAKFDGPGQYGIGPAIEDDPKISAVKERALTRYKDLAFLYLTLPGLPYIYYGEELGLVGRRYLNDDVARRDALPWGDDDPEGDTVTWAKTSGKLEPGQNKATASWYDQDNDPDSLLNYYRKLGSLRAAHPALRSAGYSVCTWAGANSGSLVAYFREGGGEKLLVAINFGWEPVTLTPPKGDVIKLQPGQTLLLPVQP